MKWLVKWWHLSPQDQSLVIEMALIMGMIKVGLKLLPLSRLKRILEWIAQSLPILNSDDYQYLEKVVWAATTVGRTMLGDQPCLTQALAVQMYYQRMDISTELCFGVIKEENHRLLAHAWVENNGQVVIGGSQQELVKYTRLPSIDWKQI